MDLIIAVAGFTVVIGSMSFFGMKYLGDRYWLFVCGLSAICTTGLTPKVTTALGFNPVVWVDLWFNVVAIAICFGWYYFISTVGVRLAMNVPLPATVGTASTGKVLKSVLNDNRGTSAKIRKTVELNREASTVWEW